MLRDTTPRFVGPSVGPSVTLYFFWVFDFFFLLHCSCSNDLVTSITAPAQPRATGVAVYPALLMENILFPCYVRSGVMTQRVEDFDWGNAWSSPTKEAARGCKNSTHTPNRGKKMVNDYWQMTSVKWQVTRDTWHVALDRWHWHMWQVTHDTWHVTSVQRQLTCHMSHMMWKVTWDMWQVTCDKWH